MYLKQNVFFTEYSIDCYIPFKDCYLNLNFNCTRVYCYTYTLDWNISTKKPIEVSYVFKTE